LALLWAGGLVEPEAPPADKPVPAKTDAQG